eukprot:contig_14244_g3410
MLVRNAAGLHLEDETEALSSYFSLMVASFMSVQDAARWLAGCLGVTEQALDVRSRITSKKLLQLQPAELNVARTTKLLNPKSRKWAWLCRNLRLRMRSYLSVSLTPVPNFTADDTALF